MKLVVAAFICAAAGGLVFSLNAVPPSARALPGPRLNALQLCRFGGLERVGPWSPQRAQCATQSTWRAALATHLAVRFGTVFRRLREAGQG